MQRSLCQGPEYSLTSDSSSENAFLHQREYKLRLARPGASLDDDSSVGWKVGQEVRLDLSEEPLSSHKFTGGLGSARNLEV